VLALLSLAMPAHAQRQPVPITPPVIVQGTQVHPTYPEHLRPSGIQGTTTVQLEVRADGQVGDVKVEQSAGHPDLDRAAVDAVKRWRFEPARRGKDPISVTVRATLAFTVTPEPPPDPTKVIRTGGVTAIAGDVRVQRVSLPNPVALKLNDDLFLLDVVDVGAGARIVMRLDDGVEVTVGERSTVTFAEHAGRRLLDHGTGRLTVAVPSDAVKDGVVFDVRTASALVRMREAARVIVEASATALDVDVVEGSASVTTYPRLGGGLYGGAPSAEVTMQAGQGVTVAHERMGSVRAIRAR
jgi:TonB family protein